MKVLEAAAARLDSAAGFVEVLAAAHAAFSVMLPVIEDRQDPDGAFFATYVTAGAAAATGRLALVAAPSLSASARAEDAAEAGTSVTSADDVPAGLARLGQILAERLYDAALTADDAADREACSRAAHHARQLCIWFGGDPADD